MKMQDHQGAEGFESQTAAHARNKSENDARPATVGGTEAEANNVTRESENEAVVFTEVSPNEPREREWSQRVPGDSSPGTPGTSTPCEMNQGLIRQDSSNPHQPSDGCEGSGDGGSRQPEPPVTKLTLSELDVNKIIHNPKLRHDINFDPELHFRPNLDGEKGRKKKDKADQFWMTLKEQLEMFSMDRDGFNRRQKAGEDWTLPALLKAVKEIIQTLVPQRDRDFLDEGLNIDLLMQQFNRGVADLEKLASWLSNVLKLHCAPMRDEWVDRMYRHLSEGNRNNDINEVVDGLRELLGVLEAMKLDVANHQIRCLRPVLIEDTVHFEQRFFHKKMLASRLDTGKALSWYNEGVRDMEDYPDMARHMPEFGEMASFFHVLVKMMLPSTNLSEIPTTFLFDEERIIKLRSDVYDAICIEICMRKYEDFEKLARVSHMFSSSSPSPGSSSVPSYVADEPLYRRTFLPTEFNFNTTLSRPASVAYSDRGSDHSSRNSFRNSSRPSSGFMLSPPTSDASSASEARAKALALHSSLLALLHTAPHIGNPSQRWEELAESMAIQILRFVDVPSHVARLADNFEEGLAAMVTKVQHDMFQEVEEDFRCRLVPILARKVNDFKNLSGVGVFSMATGGRINTPAARSLEGSRDRLGRDSPASASMMVEGAAARDPRDEAGMDDMATRLAHMGVLHWRVWGQLVYLADMDVELPDSPALTPAESI